MTGTGTGGVIIRVRTMRRLGIRCRTEGCTRGARYGVEGLGLPSMHCPRHVGEDVQRRTDEHVAGILRGTT